MTQTRELFSDVVAGKARHALTQRLGYRMDLHLADYTKVDDNSGVVLLAYEMKQGHPDGRDVYSFFSKHFGARVLPSMESAVVMPEVNGIGAVKIGCFRQPETRAYSDIKTEAMVRVATNMYVEADTQDKWKVERDESDTPHLARIEDDDLSDILRARVKRSAMTLAAQPVNALVAEVEQNDIVNCYYNGRVRPGSVVKAASATSLSVHIPGPDVDVVVPRSAVLEVQKKQGAAAPKSAAGKGKNPTDAPITQTEGPKTMTDGQKKSTRKDIMSKVYGFKGKDLESLTKMPATKKKAAVLAALGNAAKGTQVLMGSVQTFQLPNGGSLIENTNAKIAAAYIYHAPSGRKFAVKTVGDVKKIVADSVPTANTKPVQKKAKKSTKKAESYEEYTIKQKDKGAPVMPRREWEQQFTKTDYENYTKTMREHGKTPKTEKEYEKDLPYTPKTKDKKSKNDPAAANPPKKAAASKKTAAERKASALRREIRAAAEEVKALFEKQEKSAAKPNKQAVKAKPAKKSR